MHAVVALLSLFCLSQCHACSVRTKLATNTLSRCVFDRRKLLEGITTNHYQVVLSWVLALLSDAADRGMIAPEQLIAAQTSTEKMRQASADLMVYVTQLMPFPYVQLVTFIVKFQVFLTFTDMAYNTLTGLIRGSGPEHWTVVAGFVVFMVAVASFFEGLLRFVQAFILLIQRGLSVSFRFSVLRRLSRMTTKY